MTARATATGGAVSVFRQFDITQYRRVLGSELQRSRRRRGLTRLQLSVELDGAVSTSTLAAYESGARQCAVLRLNEICVALDEPAHELLERVGDRLGLSGQWPVPVDLNRLAEDESVPLEPLRRWARVRLRDASTPEVLIPEYAFAPLATLSGSSVEDIRRLLIALCR
ncbi:helix-turn-helix domain-containing protein [Amycolatopsis sp. SID8362]|uniref:helix-turn-helix domain-containing protein n=1 Tax=Amycolatopsis sp. SID8362 TaxID=2690346 RepID=UPI0013716AE1|nr:helix-turn-helix domain-containing protein [Amycolatopsis sp. SID8362]NBH09073.1 helix-turn-helix domain-containing protein [Amycolatopsis sp. SID8362]NED45765.1 helix-turn-helix domain-containing protein [Amycolatopsis sp. SID8362]